MPSEHHLPGLRQRGDIWLANETGYFVRPGLPTGHSSLDAELPGGGWPSGDMTELLTDCHGQGEISLLLPLLAHASRNEGWIAWVAPPLTPNIHALAAAGVITSRMLAIATRSAGETAWALRQAVESGACSAAVGWLDTRDCALLRRLQLAVRDSTLPLLLIRPTTACRLASPAVLRLQLSAGPDRSLRIDILKRRGRPASQPIWLHSRAAADATRMPAMRRPSLSMIATSPRAA